VPCGGLGGWGMIDPISEALPPAACSFLFSPSGESVAYKSLQSLESFKQLVIQFSNGRPAETVSGEDWLFPIIWASPHELIYSVLGDPTLLLFDVNTCRTEASLALDEPPGSPFRVTSGSSYATWPVTGGVSCLGEQQGRDGLFSIDVRSGRCEPIAEFEPTFDEVEVYPLFGHSWSPDGQSVALVAWPQDYLPEGTLPTHGNSQWMPILDHPSIQHYPVIRRDGSRATQREISEEAKRMKPSRLFVLDSRGGLTEVPGSDHACAPHWSPDGSAVAFCRYEDPGLGLYVADTATWQSHRVGSLPISQVPVYHPAGVLLCYLEDEEETPPPGRFRTRHQRRFTLRDGMAVAV